MHIFGCNSLISFVTFLRGEVEHHFFELFTTKVNMYWVPFVGNSTYSFMAIPLKLYRCFRHGLKICMWFEYNSQIVFRPFVLQLEHSHCFLRLK